MNISEEDTIDNTIEGISSDVTQFHIVSREQLNTFSKYCIIIHKEPACNNKLHVKLWNVLMGVGYLTKTSISGPQ